MNNPLKYDIRNAQELSDTLFRIKKLPFVNIERASVDSDAERPWLVTIWTNGQPKSDA